MATIEQVAEGLRILAVYFGPESQFVAEHDVIYAGGGIEAVAEEDVERLKRLGWYYDDDLESFYRMV